MLTTPASAEPSPTPLPALPLFTYVTRVCGGLLLSAGALVLAGWGFELPRLQSLLLPPIVMLPATALGFAFAGGALMAAGSRPMERPWQRVVGLVLAILVFLIGALTLLEQWTGIYVGLDLLLFEDRIPATAVQVASSMSMHSALAFVLSGIALASLHAVTPSGWRPAEPPALAVIALAFVALVGYAYDVQMLYAGVDNGGGMTLAAASAFTVLGLGILFAAPEHGIVSLVTHADASGIFLRRTLPAAIVVPVALGWLWDAAYDTEFAMAQRGGVSVFVVGIVAVFVTVVLASARTVRHLDVQREELLQREQAARAEAETANRAKADFLATMSHELRTPLNAITGYTDLLELQLRGPLNEAQREDVARIRRSSQYLLGLINDTLNFARLEAGRVEIALTTVPLHETLASMEALIVPQITHRELRYEYRPCNTDLQVRADRERLEQVLVNLLTNACKFTEPGGSVILTCQGRAREVRIIVRDTGRGIPPEKLDTIFEPFIQVDRHLTHESQQGVGLGLAISRDLARAMGGELTAESIVNAGSTFTLTLPRVRTLPEGSPNAVGAGAGGGPMAAAEPSGAERSGAERSGAGAGGTTASDVVASGEHAVPGDARDAPPPGASQVERPDRAAADPRPPDGGRKAGQATDSDDDADSEARPARG